MLIGKNLVMLDGKPGKEYGREYFTHGSTDESENYGKTSKGKAVLNPDGTEWQGIRPKGDSKIPVGDLVQEALNRLTERYPQKLEDKTPKEDYPFRLLLSAVDYGADLWMRGEIQNDLNVGKPISKEEAIKKLAKSLRQIHPTWKDEKILKVATAMSEEVEDSEEVAA